MKYKIGFVSNSSSSSFVVKKEGLTSCQHFVIKHHSKVAEAFKELNCLISPEICKYCKDSWDINETDTHYILQTWMDNFDLSEFLKVFGIEIKEHYHS